MSKALLFCVPPIPNYPWLVSLEKMLQRHYSLRQHISIAGIDARRMRRLNASWRHKDYATDILSFNLAQSPKDELLGELLLCLPVVRRQAKEHGHSFEREMQILIVHGCLHLLGYDHEKVSEAKVMEAREAKLLAKLPQV